MPKRIQLSRKKGWRMPPDTVKVDRTTKWGNPFIIGKHGTRSECIDLFMHLALGHGISCDAETVKAQNDYPWGDIDELKGKNLACWCKEGDECHGDVLMTAANHRGQKRK